MIDVLHFEKDFLLLTAAFTGVVLFYCVRSVHSPKSQSVLHPPLNENTRISSLSSLQPRDELNPDEQWLGVFQNIFYVSATLLESNLIWKIQLFSAELVKGKQAEPEKYEPLAATRKDAERILAPLVKKIVIKSRVAFGHRVTINMERENFENPLFSGLKTEATLHQMVSLFIDESAVMSSALEAIPVVTITWSDIFKLTFDWPAVIPTEIIEKIVQMHPEISVGTDKNRIQLSLLLAFAQEKIPNRAVLDQFNLEQAMVLAKSG